MKHLGALAVALFGLVSARPTSDPRPVARPLDDTARLRLSAALPLDEDGNSPLFGEASVAALDRWWTESSAWAALRVDRRGEAGARALSVDIRRVSPDLAMNAVPLGGGAYLIAATNHIIGSAFILTPRNDHMIVGWRLSDALVGTGAAFARALQGWTSDGMTGCFHGDGACGPMSIDRIGLLPADGQGRMRFYTLGTHLTLMGNTKGGQLAVWQWDGRSATPLMVTDFRFMVMQRAPVLTVAGADFFLTIKGDADPSHFYSCGSCEGRQAIWRFRADPDRIRDLGRTLVAPELELVNEIVDRLVRHVPVSDLSDPDPAALLAGQIRNAFSYDPPAAPGKDAHFSAMMGNWRVARTATTTRLCFDSDEFSDMFTFVRGRARTRLVAAQEVDGESCRGPNSIL